MRLSRGDAGCMVSRAFQGEAAERMERRLAGLIFTAALRGASLLWGSFPRVSPGAILMVPLRGTRVSWAGWATGERLSGFMVSHPSPKKAKDGAPGICQMQAVRHCPVDFTAALRDAMVLWGGFPRVSPGAKFVAPLRGAGERWRIKDGHLGLPILPGPQVRGTWGTHYFGEGMRTRRVSWLAISMGMLGVRVMSLPVLRSLAFWGPWRPSLARSRWKGWVE